jgi:hypothetical protein
MQGKKGDSKYGTRQGRNTLVRQKDKSKQGNNFVRQASRKMDGFCFASPVLLEKLKGLQSWGFLRNKGSTRKD